MAARFGKAVSLLEVDPDLIEHLAPEQAAAARSRVLARVAILDDGERDPWRWIGDANGHLGLLIIDGLLTRNMRLLGRTTMELLGAGDLVRPWDDAAEPASVPQSVTWTVHLPTRVAVLDQRFVERIAPWPGITTALVSRDPYGGPGADPQGGFAPHISLDGRFVSYDRNGSEPWRREVTS